MTAPLHHLPPGSLAGVGVGQAVMLDGAEGHHAATVRRVRVGEQLLLSDGSGLLATGEVTAVRGGEVDLTVLSVEDARLRGPRFVLAQALAKNGRDEQAVESATELGVDAVIAWQADRCIVRWKGDRAAKSLGKWQSVATAAAKQSRRATIPEVTGPFDTARLAAVVDDAALALVLHEDAETPLAGVDLPEFGDVVLIVGPEGGIGEDEVTRLVQAGARTVRLGSTVLRSSSAGPAALAVLNAAGRWR